MSKTEITCKYNSVVSCDKICVRMIDHDMDKTHVCEGLVITTTLEEE